MKIAIGFEILLTQWKCGAGEVVEDVTSSPQWPRYMQRLVEIGYFQVCSHQSFGCVRVCRILPVCVPVCGYRAPGPGARRTRPRCCMRKHTSGKLRWGVVARVCVCRCLMSESPPAVLGAGVRVQRRGPVHPCGQDCTPVIGTVVTPLGGARSLTRVVEFVLPLPSSLCCRSWVSRPRWRKLDMCPSLPMMIRG